MGEAGVSDLEEELDFVSLLAHPSLGLMHMAWKPVNAVLKADELSLH